MKLFLFTLLLSVSAYAYAQKDSVRTLGGITITGKKPLIERKVDRTVVNVDAFISNAGSNALEILEQSPGVQVNNDAISLKGKQSVTILIDNKPTYLAGSDLANYLRSLPAGLLDKIEIMTNPSARYDAAGNGGIINIKLKKGSARGFNGSLLSENTQGRYTRLSQSANFNLRRGKVNVFGNLNIYDGTGMSEVSSYRSNPLTQEAFTKTPNSRIVDKIGMDYYVTRKTTLGVVFSHYYRDMHENTMLSGKAADSFITGDNKSRNVAGSNNVYLNFRHLFDSTGKELTADLDVIKYGQDYTLLNNINNEILNAIITTDIDITTFKTDYSHPVDSNTKFEVGYKSSVIRTNSGAGDISVFNYFPYKEHINAVYLNYNTAFSKLSLQLGLRLENTQQQGGAVVSRNYTQLFPTVFLSYKLADNLLNFTYGRRIDRPDYISLNPYEMQWDKYTYQKGNPLLAPQFSDNYELSYIFRNRFTLSAFYNNLRDGIEDMVTVKEAVFYHSLANVGRSTIKGFSVDGTLQLTKWWVVNPTVLFTYTHTRTGYIDVEGPNWDLSATHQFNFKKGWGAELMMDYTSSKVYAQFVQAGNWYVHAGFSKKIWKDNASIKLNFRDIFYTRVDRQDFTNIKGVSGFTSRRWDTRNVTLALSYRLSRGLKATRSPRRAGTSEESRRLGEP